MFSVPKVLLLRIVLVVNSPVELSRGHRLPAPVRLVRRSPTWTESSRFCAAFLSNATNNFRRHGSACLCSSEFRSAVLLEISWNINFSPDVVLIAIQCISNAWNASQKNQHIWDPVSTAVGGVSAEFESGMSVRQEDIQTVLYPFPVEK